MGQAIMMMKSRNVSLIFVVSLLASGCSVQESEPERGIENIIKGEGSEAGHPHKADDITWKSGIGGDIVESPGGVSVSTKNGIISLNSQNGEEWWRYYDYEGNLEVNHTSDRQRVVISRVDEGEVNHDLVNARSGDILDSSVLSGDEIHNGSVYFEGGAGSLDQGQFVAPNVDYIEAYSLEGGSKSWESPNPFECADGELDARFGDSVIVGGHMYTSFACSEHARADSFRVGVDGRGSAGVFATDLQDGSEAWRVEEDGPEDILSARAVLSSASNGDALLQSRAEFSPKDFDGEEYRALNPDNGDSLLVGSHVLVDFNSRDQSAVVYDDDEHAYVKTSENGVEEDRAQVPADCEVRVLEDEAAVLDQGVLTGCETSVGVMDEVRWLEWGSDDSGHAVDLGVEYEELTDIVKAPGAVVIAYERDDEPAGVVGLS